MNPYTPDVELLRTFVRLLMFVADGAYQPRSTVMLLSFANETIIISGGAGGGGGGVGCGGRARAEDIAALKS